MAPMMVRSSSDVMFSVVVTSFAVIAMAVVVAAMVRSPSDVMFPVIVTSFAVIAPVVIAPMMVRSFSDVMFSVVVSPFAVITPVVVAAIILAPSGVISPLHGFSIVMTPLLGYALGAIAPLFPLKAFPVAFFLYLPSPLLSSALARGRQKWRCHSYNEKQGNGKAKH